MKRLWWVSGSATSTSQDAGSTGGVLQDSSVRNADKHPHKYRCLAAPQPTRARAPCAAWQLCSAPQAQQNVLPWLMQHDVTPLMRRALVAWLLEVADELGLSQEMCAGSASLLERFSAVCAVPRHEIQLLGVTCLWVAAKFDRVHTPPARFFAAMTSGLCSVQDMLDMELRLLAAIKFVVRPPTAHDFFTCLVALPEMEPNEIEALARCLLDAAALPPSCTCTSAACGTTVQDCCAAGQTHATGTGVVCTKQSPTADACQSEPNGKTGMQCPHGADATPVCVDGVLGPATPEAYGSGSCWGMGCNPSPESQCSAAQVPASAAAVVAQHRPSPRRSRPAAACPFCQGCGQHAPRCCEAVAATEAAAGKAAAAAGAAPGSRPVDSDGDDGGDDCVLPRDTSPRASKRPRALRPLVLPAQPSSLPPLVQVGRPEHPTGPPAGQAVSIGMVQPPNSAQPGQGPATPPSQRVLVRPCPSCCVSAAAPSHLAAAALYGALAMRNCPAPELLAHLALAVQAAQQHITALSQELVQLHKQVLGLGLSTGNVATP